MKCTKIVVDERSGNLLPLVILTHSTKKGAIMLNNFLILPILIFYLFILVLCLPQLGRESLVIVGGYLMLMGIVWIAILILNFILYCCNCSNLIIGKVNSILWILYFLLGHQDFFSIMQRWGTTQEKIWFTIAYLVLIVVTALYPQKYWASEAKDTGVE
jgi:hypothetical protein